ncbi:Hypothetical protein HDN1F_21980 [gamma proteobacterium HdN1]|nr:Hypothetical protein HDN1F_21980 [gamma proteobacterium HdN1]
MWGWSGEEFTRQNNGKKPGCIRLKALYTVSGRVLRSGADNERYEGCGWVIDSPGGSFVGGVTKKSRIVSPDQAQPHPRPCFFTNLPNARRLSNIANRSMVRQRVGPNIYRKAMLEYWDGTCAVTGIAIPEMRRASHALPWAECSSDAERLDVFNGFLLAANLDALFD